MVDCLFAIPGDIDLPTGGYAYDRRVMALLPEFGVRTRHLPLPGSFPAPTPEDLAATEKLLAEAPADTVVLFDGLAFGALPADLVTRIRQPIVALCHHPLYLEAGLSVVRERSLFQSEQMALMFARHVIVTSPMTARILASELAVPPAKITVAEPGTDAAPRARGTGEPVQMLAVGSIVPRKGYDVLVRALSPLAGRRWQLKIAGAIRDEKPLAKLRRQIDDAGLQGRIDLLGAVDDPTLGALYAAADLFVMPSLFEGYGMVLAEALARGLPIVATTGGAAADTAPDAAALKVPPGDADALGLAVARMLDDANLRRRMGDAAWQAGQSLPRWTDTARTIAKALEGIGI